MHIKNCYQYIFNHNNYKENKRLKNEIKIKQQVGLKFLEKKLSEGCDYSKFGSFVEKSWV